MRVAFTLEEETLSHFLFTTMGKRALLGAAGVLAVVGVYYLYQQYPPQPEQKPEAAPATPPSKKESTIVEATTTNASLPQEAAQPSDDDSSRTMARQPSPHTDPSIQVQAQPTTINADEKDEKSAWIFTSASTFHPPSPKKAAKDAHTTDDPHDKDALLVEHGPDDATQPKFPCQRPFQ